MRLIWAFEFSDAVDANSKRSIPSGLGAELFDSVRLSVYGIVFLRLLMVRIGIYDYTASV